MALLQLLEAEEVRNPQKFHCLALKRCIALIDHGLSYCHGLVMQCFWQDINAVEDCTTAARYACWSSCWHTSL